jgi:hypothetical protein
MVAPGNICLLLTKGAYVSVQEEAHNADVLETLISYEFIGSKPVKDVIKEMLDFEYMDDVFDHEV